MESHPKTQGYSDQVALITGSRRGIGLGIATALSEAGFNLVLNGVSPSEGAASAVESRLEEHTF